MSEGIKRYLVNGELWVKYEDVKTLETALAAAKREIEALGGIK